MVVSCEELAESASLKKLAFSISLGPDGTTILVRKQSFLANIGLR